MTERSRRRVERVVEGAHVSEIPDGGYVATLPDGRSRTGSTPYQARDRLRSMVYAENEDYEVTVQAHVLHDLREQAEEAEAWRRKFVNANGDALRYADRVGVLSAQLAERDERAA